MVHPSREAAVDRRRDDLRNRVLSRQNEDWQAEGQWWRSTAARCVLGACARERPDQRKNALRAPATRITPVAARMIRRKPSAPRTAAMAALNTVFEATAITIVRDAGPLVAASPRASWAIERAIASTSVRAPMAPAR